MDNWPQYPLESFVDPERSISYGIVQPGKSKVHGVPIVRVNNFKDGYVDIRDALTIDPEIEAKYKRSRLQGGELLLTLVGTMGLCAIVPNELHGWNVARAVGVVPLKEDVDKRWLTFALRSQPSQDFIETHANTTVQPTFNLRDLARLPIPMPPDNVRLPASELLSALDDKIELNRRMNETLEAMAQALFKDWFVDFGPTRAKSEGRDPYLAPEIWDLFPGKLDEDGKPEGWEVFRLNQIAKHHTEVLSPAATPDTEFEHFSLPAFDAGRRPAIDKGLSIKSNKTLVPKRAVLLSKLNPEIPRVWLPEDPCQRQQIGSTEFLALVPSVIAGRALLFCLFSDYRFREMLQSMVTGTSKSHQRVSPKSLYEREVIAGNIQLFARFEESAHYLLAKTLANRSEAWTLAQARDLLLPKLISGEIRIGDADKIVKEFT